MGKDPPCIGCRVPDPCLCCAAGGLSQGSNRKAGPAAVTADQGYGDCQAVALTVVVQKDWCAHVSPALQLLLHSLEKWVAAQTVQNVCLAKGMLVRAKLTCRLQLVSHFWVAWNTLHAFCRFSR